MELHEGSTSLRNARIVAADPQLAAIIPVLERDVVRILGFAPTNQDDGSATVTLQLDASLQAEEMQITVADHIAITGGSYSAVAAATSMLLQLMSDTGELPHCEIKDCPDLHYRGLMLDLARHWHSMDTVRKAVDLCRFYRLSHLQLHLTDDQSFTFPLQSFPQLAAPGRHYTRAELVELVEYANDRGIQLVPEIDLPGHSAILNAAVPDIFTSGTGDAHENAICLGNDAVYDAVEQILVELCEVFKYSEYIHLGCDETKKEIFDHCPACRERMRQLAGGNSESLLRSFIVFAADVIKGQGRKAIVWEGFTPEPGIEIPRDIIVVAWESYYYTADKLAAAGYTIINASWQPLYAAPNANWPPEHIYGWNVRRWEHWWEKSQAHLEPIQLDGQADIIGAQFCTWENKEEEEIELLRLRVPVVAERTWNVERSLPWPIFSARMEVLDRRLMAMLDRM